MIGDLVEFYDRRSVAEAVAAHLADERGDYDVTAIEHAYHRAIDEQLAPANLKLDSAGARIPTTGPLASGVNVEEVVDDAFGHADLPGICHDHGLDRR
ncbi:hypothetical protein ACFXGA_18740 [Actinosynnema sp. NPDC059335]|uniref:hypothetical protein n=1 Tax=Actinosynnema sp. NPDC059335 TaxID=3346804 RepID=UPI00366CBC3C